MSSFEPASTTCGLSSSPTNTTISSSLLVAFVDVSQYSFSSSEFSRLVDLIWEDEARKRIWRYHKGCSSPKEFLHHAHDDTKCFLIGRLLLQNLAIRELQDTRGVSDAESDPQLPTLALGAMPRMKDLCHSTFFRTPEGKPHFRNDFHWSANVSHAGTMVALSSMHNMLNGVDVMPIELVPCPSTSSGVKYHITSDDLEEFLDCFQSYFTVTEWDWIRRGTCQIVRHDDDNVAAAAIDTSLPTHVSESDKNYQTLKRFYINWTLKESYIKAIGIGLGLELQRAEFRGLGTLYDVPDTAITSADMACSTNKMNFLDPASSATSIEMFLDGQKQIGWRFMSFDLPLHCSVAAVAVGPHSCAVSPVFECKNASSLSLPADVGVVSVGCYTELTFDLSIEEF